jgi:hypothetical protein
MSTVNSVNDTKENVFVNSYQFFTFERICVGFRERLSIEVYWIVVLLRGRGGRERARLLPNATPKMAIASHVFIRKTLFNFGLPFLVCMISFSLLYL